MLYIFDEVDKMDDVTPERITSLLSDERYEKAKRLRSPLARNGSAAVYLLLRLALREMYCINKAVDFEYSEKGKPLLKDYPQIYFSLSHSKHIAACAVSEFEVGIDVQYIAPVSDAVAKRVLTRKEYAGYKSSSDKAEYFCELWTIKESFLKKTGQGIATNIKDLAAENVTDKMIYRGKDYFCCVCGQEMEIKHIGREEFEQLFN